MRAKRLERDIKLSRFREKEKETNKREIGIRIKKGDERNLRGREEKGKQFGP